MTIHRRLFLPSFRATDVKRRHAVRPRNPSPASRAPTKPRPQQHGCPMKDVGHDGGGGGDDGGGDFGHDGGGGAAMTDRSGGPSTGLFPSVMPRHRRQGRPPAGAPRLAVFSLPSFRATGKPPQATRLPSLFRHSAPPTSSDGTAVRPRNPSPASRAPTKPRPQQHGCPMKDVGHDGRGGCGHDGRGGCGHDGRGGCVFIVAQAFLPVVCHGIKDRQECLCHGIKDTYQ